MKELSTPDKIKLLEETLKNPDETVLCYRISVKAYNLGYITRDDLCATPFCNTAPCLIPELMRIKPVGKSDHDRWFGFPNKENLPLRQEKLKELIEILKSKQP